MVLFNRLSMGATSPAKTALIISHPGHELRIHHWVEENKPLVLVLTDGSGSAHRPRLSSTSTVLKNAGARPGEIYGRFSDAELYAALIKKNMPLLCRLLDEVACILEAEEIAFVAGDALEYYNPTHDLCRYIIGAAVEIAQRRSQRAILNFDFSLVSPLDACPPALQDRAIWISLNDSEVQRKYAASRAYPELAHEVETALRTMGGSLPPRECLRPVSNDAGITDRPEEQPFYERYGQERVRQGIYSHVIRYCDHMYPIAQALWKHATTIL